MNNRIKDIRVSAGLTMEKFGDKLGVKRNTISQIESGTNNVTEQMIKSICREFGVNESWLRTGNGEMYSPIDRQLEIAKLTKTLLSEEEDSFKNRFISMLANLTEAQWMLLEDMANKLTSTVNKKD